MKADRRWEVVLGEEGYPQCLLECPRPPERLFGIGDPAVLRRGLAVVGSRKATPYGIAAARRFAGWAAREGVPVISGAAMGCDQAAHLAALDAGGPTVAVLGCGPDVDYPVRGSRLLSRIRVEGAVVSECPWGTRPTKWAFPERNRIIVALSAAVLIVEAALPSGTFSAAEHAAEAGRDLLVVPGSIFSSGSRGCNHLLAHYGAAPVTEVSDLAAALRQTGMDLRCDMPERVHANADPVLAAVSADPARADDLAYELDLDVVGVMRALSALEAAGKVARYPDGRYGPC